MQLRCSAYAVLIELLILWWIAVIDRLWTSKSPSTSCMNKLLFLISHHVHRCWCGHVSL